MRGSGRERRVGGEEGTRQLLLHNVLWTDGGELCIKAFTLPLYVCTRVEMSSHVEQNV